MSDTDLATLPAAKPDTRLQVRGKLKAALDAMIWDGMELADAARAFKLHGGSMRKAFAKPHVQAYVRSGKQVLRESLSTRNIRRLAQIRDAADNMPAIQAIRTLEQMGEEQHHAASGASASVGLTIRIINQSATPPTIDVTPNDLTHD